MRRKTSAAAEGPPTPSSMGSSSHESHESERAREGSDGGEPGNGSGGSKTARGRDAGAVVLRRRGHFKSRLGCFNCKRRRVKCNEMRPDCGPCRRLGLACEYPPANNTSPSSAGPAPTVSLLALEDLRFYHQFLTVAYPTLPLKGGEVWSNCAAMSHKVGTGFGCPSARAVS